MAEMPARILKSADAIDKAIIPLNRYSCRQPNLSETCGGDRVPLGSPYFDFSGSALEPVNRNSIGPFSIWVLTRDRLVVSSRISEISRDSS